MTVHMTSNAIDHILEDHIHKACGVFPTLAAGEAVTGGAQYVLGAYAEIVPTATIGSPFDIHYISIEALDTNAVYEIVLYAITTEVGRVRVTKNAVQDGTMNIPFQCPILPAGTQIQAKLADSDAGGGSIATISIFYHTY
jgi:hypothetical protein